MTVPADWTQLSHRQLYDAVQSGPGRAISVAAEERWARIEATITGIEQRISASLARSNGGWEGAAADTARTAVSPLGAWALDAAGDARLTAGAVVSQAEHAAELRRLLPPPVADPPGPMAGRAGRLPASPDAVAQQAAADADARRLMAGYVNHSYENDRYLDYWTVPPSVTVDSAPIGPAGAGQIAVDGGLGGAASSGAGGSAGAGGTRPDGPGPGGAGSSGASAGGAGAGGATSGGAGPSVIAAGVAGTGRGGSGGIGSAQGGGGAVGSTVSAGQAAGAGPLGSPLPGGSGGRSGGTTGVPRVPGPQGATGGSREPTAGGRGPSRATTPLLGGAVKPVLPAVPRSAPGPAWRDVVPHVGAQPRPEPPVRTTLIPEEAARPGGSRGAGLSGMYPPMMGAGGGSGGGEHRRPGWLVDGTGAFDDNRWFPPAVLIPDHG